MNMYLSTAIRRMENPEKKTQLAWVVPINLQRYSMFCPRVQSVDIVLSSTLIGNLWISITG